MPKHTKSTLSKRTSSQNGQEDRSSALSSFQDSPARFEYEVLLEEFRAARAETDDHMNNQHLVINFSLTVLAAVIALMQFMASTSTIMSAPVRLLYLFGSLVCSSFAFMYFWHDISVAYLAIFMETILFPRLEAIITQVYGTSHPLFSWAEFQHRNRIGRLSLAPLEDSIALGRLATVILPAPALIAAYIVNLPPKDATPHWEYALLIISVLASIVVILASAYSGWLFSVKLPTSAKPRWKH